MTRILLIKTSSMGDVVHNLPVLADIRRALPSATIDWVVEEAYADLVRMAHGVTRVIPIAARRWRHEGHLATTRDERRTFVDALRSECYDVVLDTQGLVKSALVAGRARLTADGVRVGFSFGLVRERLARLFYDRGYPVDPRLHAIERMRALAASALGYPRPSDPPRFELDVPPRRFEWIDGRYAVLLHATARAEKAWPVERWVALIGVLRAAGITAVLPSGTPGERAAAEAIARDADVPTGPSTCAPVVAPAMSLPAAAALFAGAAVVIGVDTGLLHIAAALDVPAVGLFGATPQWRYAPYWSPNAINLGSRGIQPGLPAVVDALARLGVTHPSERTPQPDDRS